MSYFVNVTLPQREVFYKANAARLSARSVAELIELMYNCDCATQPLLHWDYLSLLILKFLMSNFKT